MKSQLPPIAMFALVLGLLTTPAVRAESMEEKSNAAEVAGSSFQWVGEDGQVLPFAGEDAALEYLTTAEVVKRKPLKKGITHPDLLVLEKDGIRARAVFHDVDIEKDRERLTSGEIVYFFRDTYRNNVAVYELSRLLSVPNVPPAVTRRLGRAKGSVQLWVEDSYTETERRKRPLQALPIEVRRRIKDMWVFDNLINNVDRNEGNMLYDSVGGFWLIDHTRTLSRSDELPSPGRIRACSRDLWAAIRALDETETRERLAPYLNTFEIDALFSRREALVDLLDQKIADHGEENVLFSYD